MEEAMEYADGAGIEGVLDVLVRRNKESELTMGLDTEKLTQMVLGKSDLIGASDKLLSDPKILNIFEEAHEKLIHTEPQLLREVLGEGSVEGSELSLESAYVTASEELIIEVSQAVMEMTSVANVECGFQPGVSHTILVPDHLRIDPSDIKEIQKIGDPGASANVYEATWSGCTCAVKRFKAGYSKGLVSAVQQELDFLIEFRHPHIVWLMGLSVDSQQRCSIVMELMSGSLRALINSRMRERIEKKEKHNLTPIVPFTPSEALDIITKIAKGMWFLHYKGISHRDLKSRNVLVRCFGRDFIQVKIADFGASLNIDSSGEWFWIGVGTGFFRAPEILPTKTACRNLSRPDLKAADVYSFAMTCYEVLTGREPFQDELSTGQLKHNEYDQVIEGLRPKLPGNLDKALTSLLNLCWAGDPKCRPNFKSICKQLLCMKPEDDKDKMISWNMRMNNVHELNRHSTREGLLRMATRSASILPDHMSHESTDVSLLIRTASTWNNMFHENIQVVASLPLAEINDRRKFLSFINPNDLKKQQRIAIGVSSRVYAATWLGCTVAVKRFKSDWIKQNRDPAQHLDFLFTLRHPCVVQLVGLTTGSSQECMIVMEFMSSDLRQLIQSRLHNRDLPFDLHEAVLIISKTALGMAYLQFRDVVHDLNAHTVLVEEHCGHINVKLGRFGLARDVNAIGKYVGERRADRHFQAPETLPGASSRYRSKQPDLKAADVYSFAMICYEVLTGQVPLLDQFPDQDVEYSRAKGNNRLSYALSDLRDCNRVISGLRPTLPSDLHPDLKGLIQKCWDGEPENRPDFTYICNEIQRIEQAL